MILGNGDLASVLPDRDDLLFFASGVSNSRCKDDKEFDRERELLLDQPKDKHLVYFSSLATFYLESPYTWHKRDMEQMVRENFLRYTIIRIGNISWGTNPHTIINFFKNRLAKDLPLQIKNEQRYVVDIDEFLHWIDLIPNWSCEMNIPGRRMWVSEIVNEIKEGNL